MACQESEQSADYLPCQKPTPKCVGCVQVNCGQHLSFNGFLTNCMQAVKYITQSPSLSVSTSASAPALSAPSSSSVCLSAVRTVNTGTPQGMVISPFIFTLYTNDCQAKGAKTKILKFSDDTAVLDLLDSHTSFSRRSEQFCQVVFRQRS